MQYLLKNHWQIIILLHILHFIILVLFIILGIFLSKARFDKAPFIYCGIAQNHYMYLFFLVLSFYLNVWKHLVYVFLILLGFQISFHTSS